MHWSFLKTSSQEECFPDLAHKELCFWRQVGSIAGSLLLASGLLFFFAYNWDLMHRFSKLGLLLAFVCAALTLPLLYGAGSLKGKVGTLFSALVIGVLFAIFGQIYQTGADAVDLFRLWALFLVPLALASRNSGVWFMLWFVSTLWGALHFTTPFRGSSLDNALEIFSGFWWRQTPLFFIFSQMAFLAAWEAATAHWCQRPGFDWLKAFWVPRTATFLLAQMLLGNFAYQVFSSSEPYSQLALYSFILAGWLALLWLWHRPTQTKLGRPDLVMLSIWSYALFCVSVILLIHFGIKIVEENHFHTFDISLLLLLVAALLCWLLWTLATYLRHCHSAMLGQEKSAAIGTSSWGISLFMGVGAWTVALFLALAMGGFLFLFGVRDFKASLFIIGLVAVLLSRQLSQSSKPFLSMMSLPICIMGTASLIIFSYLVYSNSYTLFFFLAAAIFFGVGFIFSGSLRFASVALGTVSLCYALATVYSFSIPSLQDLSFSSSWPVVLGFILWSCLVVWGMLECWRQTWFKEPRPESTFPEGVAANESPQHSLRSFFQTPATSIGLFAGMALYCLLSLTAKKRLLDFAIRPEQFSLTASYLGAGAAIALIQFRRMARPHTLTVKHFFIAVFLVPLCWHMPGLGFGLLGLSLGQTLGLRGIIGASALFIATYVSYFYYSLHSTLLEKSIILGVAGLLLLLFAAVLGRLNVSLEKQLQLMPPSDGKIRWPFKGQAVADKISAALLAGLLLCLVTLIPWQVRHKELLLERGVSVLLPLAPVDPRSLMQGDYMRLNCALDREISSAVHNLPADDDPRNLGIPWQGLVVLNKDADGVGHFVRLHLGDVVSFNPQSPEEFLFLVKKRSDKWRSEFVLSRSFFFQEGNEPLFAKARFAEFRVGADGVSLLQHLANEHRQIIVPNSPR